MRAARPPGWKTEAGAGVGVGVREGASCWEEAEASEVPLAEERALRQHRKRETKGMAGLGRGMWNAECGSKRGLTFNERQVRNVLLILYV